MSIAAVTAATNQVKPAVSLIIDTVKNLLDPTTNSLTSYAKTGRISSRVYIDASISSDPVITDILKTVHTQYCAFILTALQMNQFVSAGVTVQDLLKVVATEDYKTHLDVVSSFGVDSDRLAVDNMIPTTQTVQKKSTSPTTKGEITSFAGDSHIPAGKLIEVTMTNPSNPEHKVTLNLLVQLAPYIVPEPLAVQFIVKDVTPSFFQRLIQWKTGEISFWKDFILGDDIIKNRQKLLKMDPSGVFADMMHDQEKQRGKTLLNYTKDKDNRARNIANSVLIFSQDTVTRAKAESGVDLNDYDARKKYFNLTFSMIIVIVDILYNQVTFYYNGIPDVGTFSFEQMKVAGKNGSGMDLVSVMNALSQGRSPKF